METLPIERALTLSSAHITQEDAWKLESYCRKGRPSQSIIAHAKSEYGWFIHIPANGFELADTVSAAREEGYSESFALLLRAAHENKCEWLQIDRDATTVEGFATFSW